MRRLLTGFGLLVTLSAMAACSSAPPTANGTKAKPRSTAKAPATSDGQGSLPAAGLATVNGVAKSPAQLLANGGGSIISGNGAGLITNNSAGLITNNSAGLITNNSAGLVSGNGASYRLLASEMVPVAGATAVLMDAERRRVRGVQPVKTDASGRFAFKDVPAGANWIVEVQAPGFALTAIAPTDSDAPVTVTPATTIVTEHLRTALEDRPAALRVVPRAAVDTLTTRVEQALAAGDVRVDLSSRAKAAQTFDQIVAKAPTLAEESRRTVDGAREEVVRAVAAGKIRGLEVESLPEPVVSTGPSADLAQAAARIAGYVAGRQLGAPWDVGAGSGVQLWHGLPAQFFYGGTDTEAHCMVVDGPNGPKLVRNAFYDSYLSGGQYWTLGAPLEDDVALDTPLVVGGTTYEGPARRQRFERGTLYWNERASVVTELPPAAPTPRPAAPEVRYPPEGVAAVNVTTLAGGAEKGSKDGDPGKALLAKPWGMAAAADGTLYVAEFETGRIRRIGLGGQVSTVEDPNRQPLVFLNGAAAVAVADDGTLYVAEGDRIVRFKPGQRVEAVAGGKEPGMVDGPGASARFRNPRGLALSKDGALYVADASNHRIRKIALGEPGFPVSTLAGSDQGFTDGRGTAAKLTIPHGLAIDGSGTLYVTDTGNNAIRRISPAGDVLTLSGVDGAPGTRDGSGKPTAASRPPTAMFNRPMGIAINPDGDLYITEEGGHAVRKIAFGTATSFTLAGTSHQQGFADGAGDAAKFNGPAGIAVDRIGQIYVADRDNHRVRKIVPQLQFSEGSR